MGGGMGGGTGVIDPPPGARFSDPPEMPNLTPYDTVDGQPLVTVDLECRKAEVDVNGTAASLLTYNGYFPAPTIRVRRGDRLRVNFTNSLEMLGTNILGDDRDMTNLHTHGLHVSPSDKSDNAMRMFMPGDSDFYEYDLSMQAGGTLNFYHPHSHGTVAEQYWGGMAGALVVEDDIAALAGIETHLMILKDIALQGTEPAPYSSLMDFMHGKEGNVVMVNGQVNPVLPIRPGQLQRWRVLNASNARFYMLSLEGHTFYLAGTEGGLLDKPYPLSRILLSPGERVDLLVRANQSSRNYRLLSLPYDRGCGGAGQQVTLLTLSYGGRKVANQPLPSVINPDAVRDKTPPVKTEKIYLSMGQGKGYVNGISFSPTGYYSICSRVGTYEIWEVYNQSMMDHPFHQHVNPCQVLSISGGDAGYAALYSSIPAWKDVVVVPKMGSVRMLVPVMDFDGMAMFHCHIVEHEDIGMMGVWELMDGGM
jgi:FtsP/CotA-like multicopper oxidase with cupredoxin domain